MAHSEIIKKSEARCKRALRVRNQIRQVSGRVRLSVFKSNKHLAVQLIDDAKGHSLGGIATYSKEFQKTAFNKRSKESAKKLGMRIAEIAQEKGIKEVVLDRGPFSYHGLIAELANAAREAGLNF
jgi:large subunit ribosomal protein L18